VGDFMPKQKPQNFIRAFKAKEGMTPEQWRKGEKENSDTK